MPIRAYYFATERLNELKEMVRDFAECGLCKRCVARYMCGKNYFYDCETNVVGVNFPKKLHVKPCIVCLGLLDDAQLKHFSTRIDVDAITLYESMTFKVTVAYPLNISIREHCMKLYARRAYPDYYQEHPILPIQKAWARSMSDVVAPQFEKTFFEGSELLIKYHVSFKYELQELKVLGKFDKTLKVHRSGMSKAAVIASMKKLDEATCSDNFGIPPFESLDPIEFASVTFKHQPLYMAGRYRKYCRSLQQVPDSPDNMGCDNDSVQDIIIRGMKSAFMEDDMTFYAAGREDNWVRCLGRGRPFVVKVYNPRRLILFPNELLTIKRLIKKTTRVEIFDLQSCDAEMLTKIVEGEKDCTKTYDVLCMAVKGIDIDSYINTINNMGPISVTQRTPIRVIHNRRTHLVGETMVYEMRARRCEIEVPGQKLFEVEIKCESELYLREFIHGDMGRSSPSLASILNDELDIVCYDVVDIDLKYLPQVNLE